MVGPLIGPLIEGVTKTNVKQYNPDKANIRPLYPPPSPTPKDIIKHFENKNKEVE